MNTSGRVVDRIAGVSVVRFGVVALSAALLAASCSGTTESSDSVAAVSEATTPPGSVAAGGSILGSGSVAADSEETVPADTVPADTATAQVPDDAGVQPAQPVQPVQPEGFSTATVRITKADGTTCDVCMWLADESAERSRGLMGVTSLGAAQGMAFVFDQPTNGAFFMFQTITPLSIAWFASDGGFVSATDMDPCVSEVSGECERFPAGGEFQLAIEVFQGDLEAVGITGAARAQVLAGTEATTCPALS